MDEKTPEEVWADYLLHRKLEYMSGYRQDIGREYDSNASWWDALAERDWEILEARLKAGFGVEQALKAQLGEDFFERKLAEEVHIVETTFSTFEVGEDTLNLYTYSDFIMLSNQGIFRDAKFLIDKERRWEKKTIKQVEEHGYVYVGCHPTNEMAYLIFELV